MCELLGISSGETIHCNALLREFYSHGTERPDGWGGAPSIEKEPVSAVESAYLRSRLTDDAEADVLLAHIRKASAEALTYDNSHPFVQRNGGGRSWAMLHNGDDF